MMKTHIIEIDAHEAFLKIGVDLRVSPITAQSVDALQKHIKKCITPEMVVAALADAARAGKKRRGRKQSAKAVEIKPEGSADET